VEAGLSILSGLVGSNITISVIGAKGAIVTKISGHDDPSKPYQLGDLCEDDRRLVVVEADVMPPLDYSEEGDGEQVDILKYTWSYKNAHHKICELKGVVPVRFTSDHKKIEEIDAVKVAIAMGQATEKDGKILEHLSRGSTTEATQLKKEIISGLEPVEKIDQTGLVAKLLRRHRITLEEMEKNAHNVELLQRNVGYDYYHGGHLESSGLV